MLFVEQLPAREGEALGEWAWTSAVMHCGGARDDLITDHPLYWQTGNTPFEREQRHRAKLTEPIDQRSIQRFENGKMKEHWGGPHCMHGIGLLATETPKKIEV